MRQQNRNGATKLRQGGAHRTALGEVIASRPEPGLCGLSKLDLLRDPNLEPLASVVAARNALTAVPASLATPPLPAPPPPTPHPPPPPPQTLTQLVRREIPPPVSRRALEPLLDNQLPIR